MIGTDLKLLFEWLDMIQINMRITERVDKLPGLQVADMSQDAGQKGVGGNVKRDTKTWAGGKRRN